MINSKILLAEEVRSPLSLRENMLWTLAGNISSSASQWLVLLILVRLDTAESAGAFALASAVTSPIFLFASLHLRTVQATDVRGEFSFPIYLSARLVLTSLALCTCAVLACSSFGHLSGALIPVLAGSKAVESISDIIYGHLQRIERMDRIGQSMMLRYSSGIVALLISLFTHAGLLMGLVLGLFASLGVLACDLRVMPSCDNWFARQNWGGIRSLLKKASPLGLLLLLVSLNANIPRYFLAISQGTEQVGRYAAMTCIAIAANTFVMAMGQSSGPSMARAFQTGSPRLFLSKAMPILSLSALLAISTILAVWICGARLLTLLYGNDYARLQQPLLWICVAGAVGYVGSALGYLLSSSQLFVPQVPLLLGVSAVTALACAIAVPGHSLAGAAMGQLAGSCLQVLLSIGIIVYSLLTRFDARSTR